MPVTSVYCRVLGRDILRVTKLGGWAADVVCPEREAETGICRLKRDADEAGQLELLLVAVGDVLAEPGDIQCPLN